MFQDVGQWHAEDDTDRDLADDACPDDLRGHPFGEGQEEEERYYDEDLNNWEAVSQAESNRRSLRRWVDVLLGSSYGRKLPAITVPESSQ